MTAQVKCGEGQGGIHASAARLKRKVAFFGGKKQVSSASSRKLVVNAARLIRDTYGLVSWLTVLC